MPDHIPPAKQYSVIYGIRRGHISEEEHEKFHGIAAALPNHDHRGNMRPAGPRNRREGSLPHVGNVPQYHGGHKGHGGVGLYIQNRGFRVGQKEPQTGRQFHGAGCLHPRKRGGLPAGASRRALRQDADPRPQCPPDYRKPRSRAQQESRTKPDGGSWNCWAACRRLEMFARQRLTAGTLGATKPRKHRRNGKCLIF